MAEPPTAHILLGNRLPKSGHVPGSVCSTRPESEYSTNGRDPSLSDIERFRGVYDENYARILGYALRRTRSPEDAADVVAETFLTAWRRLAELPTGDEARLWLYGVARRTLANNRRGNERRDRLRMALRESAATSLARSAAPASTGSPLEQVAEAFHRLRTPDRDVLGLVVWEGLSYEELASVLGCTQGAARLRVHRARRRFALHLAQLGIDVKRQPGAGHAQSDGPPPVTTVEETC